MFVHVPRDAQRGQHDRRRGVRARRPDRHRRQPEAYVDISEEFDAKYEAIQHHESQKAYMDVFGSKLGEDMRIFNAFRGLQYGCKYAECFSSYKIHGYMAAFRLPP